MTPKASGHRGDLRRDRTRSQAVKNQYASFQPSNNPPLDNVRSAPRNNHAKTPTSHNDSRPLNPQTLHENATKEAQLFQDPYYAHTIRQDEVRNLQDSFYSLGVDIPPGFYQNKTSGIYQNQAYDFIATQQNCTPGQAYSNQYLAPETTISCTEQAIDDDYTRAGTRAEYKSNGQDVIDPGIDLNGVGGQFSVYLCQTPPYSSSVYQVEADLTQ
ncbi:hypothetical protein DID88_002920 [Monilinia fructigena]|uniref:Uncharacterized protein n=1 Tax=Monilinia fructigena TaxID=38457 RepID=A0A395INI6_9HELO|nr:hypothetical protein DID88_002920 [Monilinia fructigena]